ncbi:MAG: apolipoprotein N-acyltransferase, partial [Phycisphaerales bacterium]|nr:apolipoprotein N-acyltransferase [Phycisphaerales bacterium]
MQPLIDSPGQILAGPAAIASISGMYFVGQISAMFGFAVVRVILGEDVKFNAITGSALVTGWCLLGWIGVSYPATNNSARQLVVGIVQPNVPQDNRMSWTDRQRYVDWLMLRQLTEGSAIDPLRPDLIVWPEGFVPGWTFDPISLQHERDYGFTWNLSPKFPGDAPGDFGLPERVAATTIVDELLFMQSQIDIPMIVGSVAYENLDIQRTDENWVLYKNDGMFNSAFVVQDGEVSSKWYNKMHLTPFGEVMPIISNWEWLEQQLLALGASGMEFTLSPGDDATVLDLETRHGSLRAGVPICFEATVPGVTRELVFDQGERRADVLINITNDGWFGSWEPSRRAHMLIARWRCIEVATPMIRSANSGVSCVINQYGKVTHEWLTRSDPSDPKTGYLNATVQLGSAEPFPGSGLIGAVFGWGVLAMTLTGLLMSFSQKQSEPEPATDE